MASFRSTFAIQGIDKLSVPFKSISRNVKETGASFRQSSKDLKGLQDKLSKITSYNKNLGASRKLKDEWLKQQKVAGDLAREISNTEKPTRKMINEQKRAFREAEKLRRKHERMTEKVSVSAAKLNELGISTKHVGQETYKLRQEEQKLNKVLEDQKKRLDNVTRANKQLSKARDVRAAREQSAANLAIAGQAARGLGLGIFQKAAAPVGTSVNFEAAMSGVAAKALSGVQDPDQKKSIFKRLEEDALALGSATSFSATQVASAQEKLAMAGVHHSEINQQTLKGLLATAKAGQLELADATSLTTSVVRGFGLQFSQIGEVGDILAFTANNANTNMSEMAEVFKDVGPVAKTAGVNLKQVSGMIGVLANVGVRGGIAGTALKNTLLNLASPASSGAKALDRIGVATKTAEGKLKPLTEIFADIAQKTQNMGEADRIAIFEDIGGREAIAGFSALIDKASTLKGVMELKKIENNMDSVRGTAQRMGDALSDNAQGKIVELGSAWEGLSITIGKMALPMLKDFTVALTQTVRNVREFATENPKTTKTVLGLGLAFGGLVVVGGTLLTTIASIKAGFAVMAFAATAMKVKGVFALTSFATAFTTMAKVVGLGLKTMALSLSATGIGALVVGLGLAAGLVIANWDKVKSFFLSMWEEIKPIWETITSFVGAVGGPFVDLLSGKNPGEGTASTQAESFITGANAPKLAAAAAGGGVSVSAPVNISVNGGDPEEIERAVKRGIDGATREAEKRQRGRMFD